MLESLTVEHLRPYVRAKVSFKGRMSVLFGPNGAGKTSLLESIHALATTKSFRASRLAELIQHEKESSDIQLMFSGHKIQIQFHARGRKLRINDKAITKVMEFCCHFKTVLLAPEHISIISGSPEERRKYLDQILFFQNPNYATLVQNYQKALKQKRALLKSELNLSNYLSQVSVWNTRLIEDGNCIRQLRIELAKKLQNCVPQHYKNLAQNKDLVHLRYSDETNLHDQIEKLSSAEHAACRVLCGPHKDDLEIYLNQQLASAVGSQGERASLLLGLKFAELELLKSETPTLLLLDDIGITLDPKRRAQLFERLKEYDLQSIITTSDPQIRDLCKDAGGDIFESTPIEAADGQHHTLWSSS